jgi:hypothetical protein
MRIIPVLIFLLLACNGGTKQNKEATPSADTSAKQPATASQDTADAVPKPLVDSLAGQAVVVKKCFTNEGLKYAVAINFSINGTKVIGKVTSTEMGSGSIAEGTFTGTSAGRKITVKFDKAAPIVGDASQWTGKDWVLKQAKGKEILAITFNAKNYETGKWADMEYEFTACQ